MEAILRISKAEAQLHLSPTVEITHIERAVDLINFSLTQAGTDSVGNLDSSLLNAGVDSSQRDTNRIIRETIRKLQKDGGASLGDIALNVADSGITREKLVSYLSHLKRNGEIFQTGNEKWRLAQ
jgi:DNA replicative helicase MCM subunit Mcm2 (Cdc46/Mcm family)